VYHSEDAGRTWLAVGDLPKATKRVAFSDESLAFAEAEAGWFRSDDGVRTWSPSMQAEWDQHELQKAIGDAKLVV
jgi:hypothetical protein